MKIAVAVPQSIINFELSKEKCYEIALEVLNEYEDTENVNSIGYFHYWLAMALDKELNNDK